MVTTLQQWTAKKSRLDSHFLSNSRTGRMCCALIKLGIDTFSNFFTGLMDLSAFFFPFFFKWRNIIDIQFMHKRSKVLFHKANDVWFGLGIKITCKFDLFYHSNFWVCMCDLWQTKPILKNIDTISLLVWKFTIPLLKVVSKIRVKIRWLVFLISLKFINSEKATKFCEISAVDLSYVIVCSFSQIYGGDFGKFCGLIRIYEL